MAKQNAIQELDGTFEQFNFSPKGSYEGLLVRKKHRLVQLNFPSEFAGQLAQMVSKGDQIRATAELYKDDGDGAHPVYNLLTISAGNGVKLSIAEGELIRGKVKRLNYAKHGEPNGAVLDTGDFVHLKPHGAKLIDLKVGQMLEVSGEAKPMIVGNRRVIEAETVNGIALGLGHAAKKKAPKTSAS